MRRNLAGQRVHAQILSATDGSPVTSGITVQTSVDGANVAGGTPSHLTGGKWQFLPTQAQTNGDHVSFTFSGTGALSVTVQAYPTPWSANAPSVNVDEWDGNAAAVKVSAAGLASVDAEAISGSPTAADQLEANIPNLDATVSSRSSHAASDIVTGGAIGTAAGAVLNVGTVDTTTTNADMRGTDGANTTVPPTAGEVADAVLDEALTEPTGVFTWAGATLRTIIPWLGALARNKVTQTSSVQTLRNDADNATIATANVDDTAGTFTRNEFT